MTAGKFITNFVAAIFDNRLAYPDQQGCLDRPCLHNGFRFYVHSKSPAVIVVISFPAIHSIMDVLPARDARVSFDNLGQ